MDEEEFAVQRLTSDLHKAAATLSDQECRYLVDYYYIAQDDRKRSSSQALALDGSHEPNGVVTWLANQSSILEGQIKSVLDKYTQNHEMGEWMRSVFGIGPVISAGLLANINMEPWVCYREDKLKKKKCTPEAPCTASCKHERIETVGHIWSYAGLDPTKKWEKGQLRPWNPSLKVLCWKAGQSFMKFSNSPKCRYGHLYRERKAFEVARNESGANRETALREMERYDKNTEAYTYCSKGVLPPAQIDARARRWVVKIFLSHLHAEWYRRKFKEEPPKPFAIAVLGHAHMIEP